MGGPPRWFRPRPKRRRVAPSAIVARPTHPAGNAVRLSPHHQASFTRKVELGYGAVAEVASASMARFWGHLRDINLRETAVQKTRVRSWYGPSNSGQPFHLPPSPGIARLMGRSLRRFSRISGGAGSGRGAASVFARAVLSFLRTTTGGFRNANALIAIGRAIAGADGLPNSAFRAMSASPVILVIAIAVI